MTMPLPDGFGWFYCPDCGNVGGYRTSDAPRCEINGAGMEMVLVHEAVAEALIQAVTESIKDDGTWLRVGPVAFGRVSWNGRAPWFVKRFADGVEISTGFGSSPLAALVRSVR